ncbi:MAG: mechanosensitive ion channel family protein [Halobacteriaceae archaeon]
MTLWMDLRTWLHGLTATLPSRMTATILVIVVVGVVTAASLRATEYLRDRTDPAIIETASALVLGAVGLAGATTLVTVWRVADQVAASLTVLEADPALVGVTGIVLAIAYTLTRLTRRFIRGFPTGTAALSNHQREVLHHVVQVIIYVLAVLVVLSLWNVDVGNLLLGAGVLGIVLGLAARQTLGAVLAGFVVLFSRPFEVGDWVIVDDREGIVKDITIVNTRLRTFDGEVIMIPNDIITGTEVVNRSREGRLRLNVDVGIDYESDVSRAMEVAQSAMQDLDPVRSSPSPHAVLAEFGDSAVVLRLRFWIDDPSAQRYWRARTAVVEAVKHAFTEAGIKIPFPQRELSGRAERGGLAIEAEVPPTAHDGGEGEHSTPDIDD